MTTFPQTNGPKRGITGLHVLLAMVTFFAVIVAVDATLIYKALTTFGGVDNVNAYRDGLAYNARIAADARQSDLGWQDDMKIAGDPVRLSYSLVGTDGQPVSGQRITARVGRPATNRYDRTLSLVEAVPGRYEAVIEGAESGTWLVEAQVFSGPQEVEPLFRVRRRVWVAP